MKRLGIIPFYLRCQKCLLLNTFTYLTLQGTAKLCSKLRPFCRPVLSFFLRAAHCLSSYTNPLCVTAISDLVLASVAASGATTLTLAIRDPDRKDILAAGICVRISIHIRSGSKRVADQESHIPGSGPPLVAASSSVAPMRRRAA